jgi:hypothetical protein
MRVRKPKYRAGELLGKGGCIFLTEPETFGCGVMKPMGVRHLKDKLGAFGSLSRVVSLARSLQQNLHLNCFNLA